MQQSKKPWRAFAINIAIPVALIIIIGFIGGFLYGFLATLIFLLFKLYQGRTGLYSAIGKIVYSKGSISDGVKWFERAYKTGKSSPRIILSYAYLLLKQGRIDEAEVILNKLLAMELPLDDQMFVKANLALIVWKRGDIDGAIAMLEEVCANVKHTITYGSLGYMLILKGELDKALEFNLEAYDYNSSNTVIQDNLGQNYYMLGDYDKAEEIYLKFIPSNPTFPEAYYNYGLVLLARGLPEKALEYMKKALNYEFSYLSAVTREEIQSKIEEVSRKLKE